MKPRMVGLMLMTVVVGGADAEPRTVPIKPSPAQGPVVKATTARYVTPQQIKIYWYNKLPVPRTMDRDYHPAMKARAAFVAEIRAGVHDLAAEKTAAQYNKQEALRVGDMQRAKLCEVEIARITQQEMELARQHQQQRRDEETMMQMNLLDTRLRSINRNLDQIRDVLWSH